MYHLNSVSPNDMTKSDEVIIQDDNIRLSRYSAKKCGSLSAWRSLTKKKVLGSVFGRLQVNN